MSYLLCISTRGLHPKNPLRRGFTYRQTAFNPSCSCAQADKLVCVEELRWKNSFQQACAYCGEPLRNEGHVALLAARFVPFDEVRDAMRKAGDILSPSEVDAFIEQHLRDLIEA